MEEDPEVFKEALNEWYKGVNANKWLSKWKKENGDDKKYIESLGQQVKWCLDNEIISTPKTIINGKLFPEEYHLKDIEHFIEPIIVFEKQHIKVHA